MPRVIENPLGRNIELVLRSGSSSGATLAAAATDIDIEHGQPQPKVVAGQNGQVRPGWKWWPVKTAKSVLTSMLILGCFIWTYCAQYVHPLISGPHEIRNSTTQGNTTTTFNCTCANISSTANVSVSPASGFSISLMERLCTEVNADSLDGAYSSPFSLIILSLLAPAVSPAIALAKAMAKQKAAVWKKRGRWASCGSIDSDSTAQAKDERSSFKDFALELKMDELQCATDRNNNIVFAVTHLVLSLAVMVSYQEHISSAVTGSSFVCTAAKVLTLPLYTPFTVSMWSVLLQMANYAQWEQVRVATPEDVVRQGLIPADLQPVTRNVIMDLVLGITGIGLSVWCIAASVFAPALVGFFPAVLVLF